MTKKMIKLYRRLKHERGSALLVSLMVIVGLSMLGLGFVAISETEAAISVNQRNREEVLSHAEAAANVVVDWFQNPVWALGKGLMPSNDPTVNSEITASKAVRTTTSNTYKPKTTNLLFDLPFKPANDDRLFGDEQHPDVLLNYTTSPNFLDNFNGKLFSDTTDAGVVTEIRIYAPPIVGGSKTGGFFNANIGDRYGVATIRVTARKYSPKFDKTKPEENIIAQRVVTLVVTEFPFPGPNGPIQSNSSIAINGNFQVFWGEVSSQTNLTPKMQTAYSGVPWVTAWDQASFEHGYDSSTPWSVSTTYHCSPQIGFGDVVHASPAKMTADPNLKNHAFQCIYSGGTFSTTALATDEPAWDSSNTTGLNKQYIEAPAVSNVWQEVPPKMYPNWDTDTADHTDGQKWLFQLNAVQLVDPWAQARTRASITTAPTTAPLPYGHYNNPASVVTCTSGAAGSGGDCVNYFSWFQSQTVNVKPDYQIVDFPHIDYEFWRSIAQAGDGQVGIYYFAYDPVSGLFYRKNNPANKQTFQVWSNACTGVPNSLGPGFYFFDTIGSKNPQPPNNPAGLLTPAISVKASSSNPCYCMKGFIYLNSVDFGTQGVPKGEANKYYAYPGEPFRDVGYREVDETTGKFVRDVLGNVVALKNPNPGKWDYQDMNHNDQFDYVVRDITYGSPNVKKPDGTMLPTPTYAPIEYYEGCTIGTNCSEPHEPYLNIIYPTDGNTPPASLAPPAGISRIGWQDPAAQTRLPKAATTTAMTSVIDCTQAANYASCTSNGYDDAGPLAKIANGGPMLEGVLYNEGTYTAQGNAAYYGSLLINGPVGGVGTPNIYFDESLVKGDFKKKFPNFPRVYVSSYSVEQ